MSKIVSLRLTPHEYCELVGPMENYTQRRIFNAAIQLTHRITVLGKRMVSLTRDDFGGIPQKASKLSLKLAEEQGDIRRNADLTMDSYSKLLFIKQRLNLATTTTAMVYCLKTLRKYTDNNGYDCISSLELDKPERKRVVSFTCRLEESVYNLVSVFAKDNHRRVSEYIEEILSEHVAQVRKRLNNEVEDTND